MGETTYTLENDYFIKIVDDMKSFYRLRSSWDELMQNQTSHVPFLCFDWFRIWLEHFLDEKDLFILLLFKFQRLVAIAPFIIYEESYKGILKAKKISLIGNVHSPIRNFIFHKPVADEEREEFLFYIFSFFQNQFKDWDVIELDSIPEENQNIKTLRRVIDNSGIKKREYFCYNDWVLDKITISGDEYIRGLPKNLRKETGKRKRRLEKKGELNFKIGENKEKLDYYLNLYYEVREKSWKHSESNMNFLNDFRKYAMEKGWLKFSFLFFDGSPISCHIRLSYKKVIYFWESVYDLKYKKFSPTTILRFELMKYVIDKENVKTIHTIRGDEKYKKDWTPIKRQRRGITVFNNNFKGLFIYFLMTTALPIIKKYAHLLPAKNNLIKYKKKY